ncbi:hypothetical protein [Streptomyces sp. NBC_01455]|uniref:hypothetical protein n=1 Tax=Streptomyces sp. NBC_01455 TaxID=2903874 RepID=UPI002E31FA13|nr:hypothetical protein [Streptomyces sp. NBC_01455]
MITTLGYEAPGMAIHHNALLTMLCAVVYALSAIFGLLLTETRRTWRGLLTASAVMTCGLAEAHVLGTTALDVPIGFHSPIAVGSIAVALTAMASAATLRLMTTVNARPLGIGASLLTAAVLCAAQYTGLAAVTVPDTSADRPAEGGLSGSALSVTVAALLALVVLTAAFNLYITPVQDIGDTPTPLTTREMPKYLLVDGNEGAKPAGSRATPLRSDDGRAIEAGPVLHVGG